MKFTVYCNRCGSDDVALYVDFDIETLTFICEQCGNAQELERDEVE